MKIKPKQCKECGEPFTPTYSSLQFVCGPVCSLAYVRKQNEKKAKADWAKEKREIKENIKTKSDFEKELQKEINTIVRVLDAGFLCISTGKPLNSKFDAGHLYSCGSNPSIRFNLFNIYAQSVHANQWLSGDQLNFIDGIKTHYGEEVCELSLGLKAKYPVLKLTVDELKEATYKARGIVKYLKLQDRQFSKEERVSLRKEINEKLGIYNY